MASPKGPPPKSCNRRWLLPGARPSDPWVNYEQGSVLGQGGFGKTYQATCRQTGEQVGTRALGGGRVEVVDGVRGPCVRVEELGDQTACRQAGEEVGRGRHRGGRVGVNRRTEQQHTRRSVVHGAWAKACTVCTWACETM